MTAQRKSGDAPAAAMLDVIAIAVRRNENTARHVDRALALSAHFAFLFALIVYFVDLILCTAHFSQLMSCQDMSCHVMLCCAMYSAVRMHMEREEALAYGFGGKKGNKMSGWILLSRWHRLLQFMLQIRFHILSLLHQPSTLACASNTRNSADWEVK